MTWYNPLTWGMDKPGIYSPSKGAYQMKAGPETWAAKAGDKVAGLAPGSDLRQKQAGGLSLLAQHATGERSAARQGADYSLGQATRKIAAQAAGAQRAGYSPAIQRASMYAQAAAARDAAGAGAAAAARERLGAQQAYLGAVQAGRGQDIQSTLGLQGLSAKYTQMGLTDKAARQQALIDYEKAMLARSKMEQDAYQQELGAANKLWGGMLETGGALAGKLL